MSRVRILMVAALALSVLGMLAVPAGALSSAPSAKFCAAADKIGSGNTSGGNPTQKDAAKIYKQVKTAAKYAPSKVKAAGNRMASVLSKIARVKPSNVSDLAKLYSSSDFKAYGKATVTFFSYVATCATRSTPTTT